MVKEFDLSVIIPVFNAADTIRDVVSAFLKLRHLAIQIILIDDCSSDGSEAILREMAVENKNVEAIINSKNQGAGIARNSGFERALGRYTLFFDADDQPHVEALIMAISSLDQTQADLAMMPYSYRRDLSNDNKEMNTYDSQVWGRLMDGKKQKVVKLTDAPTLLGFSNYPWNKVLRTTTYRSAGLKFGSTPVNNDILGHWYSLLFADEILLIESVICTHIVESNGSNLTNQSSLKRLALFDALDETYDVLLAHPLLRSRYSHHYWSLVQRTASWAFGRLDPGVKMKFNLRYQEHLKRIDLEDYSRMRQKRSPQLADSILKRSLA
ncbi:MAG: hypothetical protein Salg2KO_23260 [Salibacteraceae bacterium]